MDNKILIYRRRNHGFWNVQNVLNFTKRKYGGHLGHFTFSTAVGTLSVFVGTSSIAFGTMGSSMVIFGMFGTVGTFGTPVAFDTLKIGSVFSTLSIITACTVVQAVV